MARLFVLFLLAALSTACGGSWENSYATKNYAWGESDVTPKLNPKQLQTWSSLTGKISRSYYPDGVAFSKYQNVDTWDANPNKEGYHPPKRISSSTDMQTTEKALLTKKILRICMPSAPKKCNRSTTIRLFVPFEQPDWKVHPEGLVAHHLMGDVLTQQDTYTLLLHIATQIRQIRQRRFQQSCNEQGTPENLRRVCTSNMKEHGFLRDLKPQINRLKKSLSIGRTISGPYLPIQELRKADSALGDYLAYQKGGTKLHNHKEMMALAESLLR